jgi:hypothetical protein
MVGTEKKAEQPPRDSQLQIAEAPCLGDERMPAVLRLVVLKMVLRIKY